MAEGRPRVRKYRTSGVLDRGSVPAAGVEVGERTGVGWPGPDWVVVDVSANERSRRRFVRWGLAMVAAIGVTCAAEAVFLVNGDQELRDALIWVAWAALLAGVVVGAVVALVQTVLAHVRGTARQPCVHCGLTVDGRDDRCRFCGWAQAPEPQPEPEPEPEPVSSRDDANWPWSPPPTL